MERKTYYRILGVPRSETPAAIRAAYREQARRLHPDVAGEAATRRFQDIAEAYHVLSDADRRSRYNRTLEEHEALEPRRQARPEPLAPEPVSIVHDARNLRPSLDAVLDRFLRNFTGLARPKGEHLERLALRVILTPGELAAGGTLPLGVPVFLVCPDCGGSGDDWGSPCWTCDRKGMVESQQTVQVRIPARIRPGTVIEVPLQGMGIHNFYLQLHFAVEA